MFRPSSSAHLIGHLLHVQHIADVAAQNAPVIFVHSVRDAKEAAQSFFGEGVDELVLARCGENDAEYPQELVLVGSHVLNGHHGELDRPDPAHLRDPVVRLSSDVSSPKFWVY